MENAARHGFHPRGNRLASVLTNLRYSGRRSLELAVGVNSAGEAKSAMRAELGKILVVAAPPASPN